MRKRNPREREVDDFYRTPHAVTMALLSVENFGPRVWEPFCGDGRISRVLRASGRAVVSTDLFDRGYGQPEMDFFGFSYPMAPEIVSNPPYRLAEDCITHALELGVTKLAMLLRLGFLAGNGRRKSLYSRYEPSKVWVLSERPTLWDGSDPDWQDIGGAIDYAWYVWEAGRPPEKLGWLGRPVENGLQVAYLEAEVTSERLGAAVRRFMGGLA